MLSFVGCSSSTTSKGSLENQNKASSSHLHLTAKERAELADKKNYTLSESLRHRLINDSQELQLTPEEREVLKRTGKVILCGKCGHLLGTKAYKQWETEHGAEYKPGDDFVPSSLRERILKITTD